MKIVAKKDRKLLLINTGNTQNENKAETIELTVPEEYEDYNKKIVFVTDNGIVWDIIQDNTYKLTKAITKYKQVDFYIWLTKDDVDFRSKTMPLRFYHNEDASDEITPEEISGVNTVVNLLEEEIEKVENLNIEATKIGDTTTVTITKKDGTTESVEINDGVDGQDGYTPQKGIDYFTEQDIEEIETDVKNDLEENVLVNYSLIAETGAKIELSINTTDYKLKAILKDKNNNIIHTSNVIDLPLETMVVNATYDNLNKAIILILQNGTTVSISVADLVSGLVSESQLQTILSNFYNKTEINNLLNNKVDKIQGKELSSNDFTDTLKEKLEGLENYDDTEIKADISDIQDEQIEQNTDIEKLQTENARFKATLPTTTGEGEDITLDKTAEMEFIKPPLPMGNSEQVQYSGKNIFDKNATPLLISNATLDILGEGLKITSTADNSSPVVVIPFGGQELLGKTITLSSIFSASSNNSIRINISYVNNQGTNILLPAGGDLNSSGNITYKIRDNMPEGATQIALRFYVSNSGASVIGEYGNFINCQIEEGSTATDYEPYVGGTASPNPDYPQEITNVTGDVEVVVSNKNLGAYMSGFISADGYYRKSSDMCFYFRVTKGQTYRYQSIGNRTIGAIFDKVPTESATKCIDGTLFAALKKVEPFVAPASGIMVIYANIGFSQEVMDSFQVEKGTETTSIVPHKSQILPLTLGNIELCKLGNYQDYFYKESNKWYLHKEIDKYVFTGTENWSSVPYGVNSWVRISTISTNYDTARVCAISNIFKGISNDDRATSENNIMYFGGDKNSLFIRNTELTTLADVRTATNGNYIYYILEIPTDTEITDTTLISQLEAINDALSYEEQTNISGTSDGSNPIFNVEAYQSTKLVLEEMATAIVALGGV